MEKLPPELLRQVLQYLPRSDLPGVRLSTRTLVAAAEPFLFHTIPLWIERQSLEALIGISEHPRLSQCVKEIVFSPLRFIEHEDRSLYQAEVSDALEIRSVSLRSQILHLEHHQSSQKLHLEHHMAAYDSFRAGQSYLTANSLDVKILSHAFGKLPHFRSLVVDYFSNIATIRLHKIFEIFGEHESKPPLVGWDSEYEPTPYCVACDGEYGLPALLKALANSGVSISTFRIGPSQALDPTWFDPDTMRDRFTSPRPFPVEDAEGTISLALQKTFRRRNENAYSKILRELRVLEVSETRLETPELKHVRRIINGIATIISWSSHIESITVRQFGIYNFDESETPLMSDLFQTDHLKKLQKLKLESLNTTLPYLTLFFHRYGKQLKEIEFEGVIINDAEYIDGKWSTALHRLRTIELPDLVKFEVDMVDVYDYITGLTDINPIED